MWVTVIQIHFAFRYHVIQVVVEIIFPHTRITVLLTACTFHAEGLTGCSESELTSETVIRFRHFGSITLDWGSAHRKPLSI
jgi:hypothetical protein